VPLLAVSNVKSFYYRRELKMVKKVKKSSVEKSRVDMMSDKKMMPKGMPKNMSKQSTAMMSGVVHTVGKDKKKK
jgi:hypothetical protein